MPLLWATCDNAVSMAALRILALLLALLTLLGIWPFRLLRPAGALFAWAVAVLVAFTQGRSGLYALLAAVAVPFLLAEVGRSASPPPASLRYVSSLGTPPAIGCLLRLLVPSVDVGMSFFVGSVSFLGATLTATAMGLWSRGRPGPMTTGRVLERTRGGGGTPLWVLASAVGAALPVYLWTESVVSLASPAPLEVRIFAVVGFSGALLNRLLSGALGCRVGHLATGEVTQTDVENARYAIQVVGRYWPGSCVVALASGILSGLLGIVSVRLVLGFF